MKFLVILSAFITASSAQIQFPGSTTNIDNQLLNAISSTNRNFFPQQQQQSGSSCRLPDGGTGTCGRLSQCGLYSSLFSSLNNFNVVNYFIARICRFEARIALVCCPLSGNQPSTRPISNQITERPTRRPVTSSNVPNSLFPTECGHSVNDRVVGGNEIQRGAYPWLVAVGNPGFRRFKVVCGGSLITRRHVLTAAHCWDNGNNPSHVRVGEHDVTNNRDGANPQDLRIAARTRHRGYSKDITENDIALITLERDVTFEKNIHPVCLPFSGNLKNNNFEGNNLDVVGWGSTDEGGQASPVPREANVRVASLSSCQQAYRNVNNVRVTGQQLCAGSEGRDACQGDSGGPLNYRDIREGRYYLAGITSTGVGCARTEFPGVYTRVGAYIDWIVSNVR